MKEFKVCFFSAWDGTPNGYVIYYANSMLEALAEATTDAKRNNYVLGVASITCDKY